jgi:AAHS family benzoate transporter-like MFS transporter
MVLTGFTAATLALVPLATRPITAVVVLLVVIAGFGGLGTQNLLNDHVAGYYPAAARATGLGWALGVGRLGAIAGPSYGALVVGAGNAIVVSSLGFAVPALIGAVVMSRLPRRGRQVPPAVVQPSAVAAPQAG